MEKDLAIPVSKTHSVYGRFSGPLRRPLVIIVHGLPCSIYEGLYEEACRWFAAKGYATYRFNLYGWQKDARQLIDSTLTMHAQDLDSVVAHFRKLGFKKIFVAGHSFGGPTILLSPKQDFDGVALWDPSYDISFTKKKFGFAGGKYIPSLKGYFMRWGPNVIIGKKMADEVDGLNWKKLTSDFHVPLNILVAGKGVLLKGAMSYIETANEPKHLTVVKGATHYFDDTPTMRTELYKLTKKWFDQF